MNDKIKKVISNYLVKDLYNVEIIYYRDSIWFIDRENRYWYFEYHKVDKHLWWRWSHFTQSLKIFSMDGEKEQSIFGELVNMILTKKQILEAKYPNKIFKTVGSVMNFEDKVDKVLNCEVKTTHRERLNRRSRMDEALNCEVKTTTGSSFTECRLVDEVLNCEVETTQSALVHYGAMVDEVLDSDVKISGGEMIEEDVMMNKVLEIQNIQPTERGTNDMVDFVLDVEDYTAWDGKLKPLVNKVLDSTVEIKSIRKLKGESPLQDVIVSHILDESDKVTDKLKMKEDDYVKTYSHDVYMCDHLVQNVLDIGVNSIHYDTHHHQPIVDGILKKA